MPQPEYAKVKELFLEARKLPTAQRNSFLKKRCANNAELEKQVLELLANDFDNTILVVDEKVSPKEIIDPLGLNNLHPNKQKNRLQNIFAGNRGRAGITFLVLALLVAVAGFFTAQKVKKTLATIRGEETTAILRSNLETLNYWIEDYQRSTEMIASLPEVADSIASLVHRNAEKSDWLQKKLPLFLKQTNGNSFLITDLNGNILLSSQQELVGQRVNDRFGKEAFAVAGGKPQFILPFYQLKNNAQNTTIKEQPLVWMQVPVYNQAGKIIATFGVGRKADVEFTKILRTARMGQSGETYAINDGAWFISESRFEAELRLVNLLPKDTLVSSILNLQARKKSYDLKHDVQHLTDLSSPILAAAHDKTAAQSGIVVHPSEDYKGQSVIGAWAWLPQYGFGVITQMDAQEAFAPAKYTYILVAAVVFLLLLAAAISFYNALRAAKMQGLLNTALQMGQYELKKMLQEGGMGAVYLAEHRLLKRPTAIKVMRLDKTDESSAKRFEREAHLASQLSHPNSIEIYDYGFTVDGKAYFAMELINGKNLAETITKEGPMPAGRVIHILRQICGALQEAHTLGMVHRDIKPQNIMLAKRIGLYDFVKVLDFGLAKPQFSPTEKEETRAITGTPVYISPERLKRPGLADPSADIYAVGALAYYLLSGHAIFTFTSDIDILYQVLNDMPKPLPKSVPKTLAKLVFFCLEKEPKNRPASAEELKLFLDNLALDFPWTAEEAQNQMN